jgi:hypothetical protein
VCYFYPKENINQFYTMPCSITCIVSAGFIIAMIFMTNMMAVGYPAYKEQLPESLQLVYSKIVKERTQIFYTGYSLGLFLALVLIFYNTKVIKKRMGWPSMVCITVFIAFVTNYFYYVLTPKKDWMLNHIDSKAQTQAWLDMYRTMQVYYHGSLVFGIVAVGLIAFAFRCN